MRRQNFNSSGRCANSHNGAQYPETSHPRQPYGGNLADQTSVPDRMNSRKIQRTEKPEADWPALRLELTASLNRRKATTFPGSTRLGHKDPGGRTEGRKPSYFVVAPDEWSRCLSNPAPQPGRNPPPGHSNGVRFLLSWRIGTPIILARPRTAMTVHFPAPAILSELRVILQFPRPPSDKDHFTTCVSISRLVGRFGHARLHGRLRPPKALSQGWRRAHQI